MKYKTIFIDWYKTCSNSVYWGQWQRGATREQGLFLQIQKSINYGKNQLFAQWMRGKISSEEICSHISQEQNISYEKVFTGLEESCERMSWISPQIPTLISKLRKSGVKCVIATDNADTFRRWTMSGMHLEELFDGFLISSEIGCMKYDKSEQEGIPFFDAFLEKNNLTYNEVILIDDHVDDGYFEKMHFDIIQVTKKRPMESIMEDFLM